MSLPSLPFEIIISILLLLPAKALIKFLVACKSWCAMIKNQDFIKKHFETSVATGKNYILYVPVQSKPEKTFTLLNAKNFHYESELRVPFDLPGMLNCIVVSSINGLICLTDISRFGHIIYLTNPTINKYLILPPSNIYGDELDLQIIQVSLGFGYHEKTNDFKVVRIGFVENDCYDWLDEEDDDEEPMTPPHGYDFVSKAEAVKSNTYEDEMVILSYHLGEETFQEFECPKFQGEGGVDLTECIGEFKGQWLSQEMEKL
nr:F-box/kelch-repeat protein At3g23880-like [Nicotiana tomentosiformis]